MDAPAPKRGIKASRLANSPRLQRMLGVLSDGAEHTTMEIVRTADVCAVNTAAAELRANGFPVSCRRRNRVYAYKLGTLE